MNAFPNSAVSNKVCATRMERAISLLAVLCLMVALPAFAHHNGLTYFDLSTTIEHTDVTVVSYKLVNPHGRLVYVLTDESGNEVEWTAELPSSNNMRRKGLGSDIFKPGDRLSSVIGAPSRSGANFMRVDRTVLENGDVAQITGNDAGLKRAGGD